MLGYLSLGNICSSKLTGFFLATLYENCSLLKEQIVSADKYLSIFSSQMEDIVYL